MSFEASTLNGEVVDFAVRPMGLYDHPIALVHPLGHETVLNAEMKFSYAEFEAIIKYFLSYGGSTNDPRFQTVAEIQSYIKLNDIGNEPAKWMSVRRNENSVIRKNSKENLEVKFYKNFVELKFFDDEQYSLFTLNAFCDVLLVSFFLNADQTWSAFLDFQKNIHAYLKRLTIVNTSENGGALEFKLNRTTTTTQAQDH